MWSWFDAYGVETQLCEQLEKIYIKIVPQPVRKYIDGKQKPKTKGV